MSVSSSGRCWLVVIGMLSVLATASCTPRPATTDASDSSGERGSKSASGTAAATVVESTHGPSTGVLPEVDSGQEPWFREMTAASGIAFRHVTGDSQEKPFPAANGSGLAILDFDRDGILDLYFATGTRIPIDTARVAPTNQLYRGAGGWRYDDVTATSGTGHNGYSAGVAVGDYDNDGFPDIYIGCYGNNCLYHNLGDGTFEEIASQAGAADPRWATSVCFLDGDNDGLLDIYVCNYGIWTLELNRFCGDHERNIRVFCSPTSIEPEADLLLRNRGDGRFADDSTASGVATRKSRSQGVVAADLNDDGYIDLYVGNDIHANALLFNDGHGRFQDASELSGTAYDLRGNMQAGMGVDAGDYNGDGRIDLFVTNFQNEYNSLYENLGGELFGEVTEQRGLAAESIPWIGWGTVFADFDLDGWLDVVVTNGHVDDNRHLLGQDAPFQQPPLLWRNERGHFRWISRGAGNYFSQRHVGRGLATGDLDRDGDQDLVISHQDNSPALLMNTSLPKRLDRQSLVIHLVGTTSNRDAVGSTVTANLNGMKVVRQVKGGGSYLSASDPRLFFAVSAQDEPLTVEIRWPNGARQQVSGLKAGRENVVLQAHSEEQAHER